MPYNNYEEVQCGSYSGTAVTAWGVSSCRSSCTSPLNLNLFTCEQRDLHGYIPYDLWIFFESQEFLYMLI